MFYNFYPFQINSIFVLSTCYIHVLSTYYIIVLSTYYIIVLSTCYINLLYPCYIHVLQLLPFSNQLDICFINLLYHCFIHVLYHVSTCYIISCPPSSFSCPSSYFVLVSSRRHAFASSSTLLSLLVPLH